MSKIVAVLLVVCSVYGQDEDPLNALAENIPGVPGEDYPIYAQTPDTGFECDEKVPGYYADTEGKCQLYHICAGPDDRLIKYDFLCPNGTLFDQRYFVCNWWFNVDCDLSESFYSLNEDVVAAMNAATPAEQREGKAVDLEFNPVVAFNN